MAKSRRRTPSGGTYEPHRGKALEGRHTGRGAAFDPTKMPPQALAPGPVVRPPRPAKSRYPVDYETFYRLKELALKEAAGLVKKEAAVVADKGKKAEAATAIPLSAAPMLEAAPALAPVTITNFAGITATGFLPPDCTMAAGPTHVLLAVNATVAIHLKVGGGPVVQRTLTTWFSNVITNAFIFDPKALYDQHAGRWVLVAVALSNDTTKKESWFLLSVSKTSDPTGGWFNYKLDATKDGTTATDNWADYPSVGLDNQAFYLTSNMFKFQGFFQYAKLRIIPKAAPYAGTAPAFTDFVKLKNADGSSVFTVQPCHTFGAPGTQSLVNSLFPTTASPSQNQLTLWQVTNPTTTPSLTKMTVSIADYGLPPDATQKEGGTDLNTGDVRVLNAVSRGGSVWAAMNTQHDWGDGAGVAACHWFQINPSTGMLVQQGIFGAKKRHYFYPAVMPDANGNMTMVFSRSAPTEFVSMYDSGRASTDAPGTLQPSTLLKAGVANYVGMDGNGRNRWGDYAGIGSDPVDGRLVWIYSMFAAAVNQWGTWVGSTRF